MDACPKNYVGLLNECAQKKGWTVQMDLVQAVGPDHIKTFTMTAVINGKKYPKGSGRNKKEAKQNAAKNAYEALKNDETVNTETNLDSSASTMLSQANFVCWVNEYSQKNRLCFTTKEIINMGSGANMQICSYTCKYTCVDKEFPEATAYNKKEAKEAAAKLVYESLTEQEIERVPEENGNGEGNQMVQNLNTSLQSLEVNTPTDTDATPTGDKNFIGLLNEHCQRTKQVANFELVVKRGPAHDPEFVYQVVINKKKYPEGQGKTKQEGKNEAARLAWDELHDSDFSSQVLEPSNVKPKIQLAANFKISPVGFKKKPNTNALKTPKAVTTSPTGSSPTNSIFLTDFDPATIIKIGKGGQGRVYKAKRILENATFAVKIVKFTEKSRGEVIALSVLDHCNIVRYRTSWTEETAYRDETPDTDSSSTFNDGSKFLYIQMEFCEGKTLHEWIDERNDHPEKYPERRQEAAKIINQVLEAVKYIHSKNLIHRDLKPSNIMFGHDGVVKVGDFGLVTTDEREDSGNQLDRSREVGTPSYMSPEQSHKNYDRKVDIYPLGLIYFELLWQFGTKSERFVHWKKIRSREFPEKFSVMFDFEHTLIQRMLSEKPEERPEVTTFLKDLNQPKATKTSEEHNAYKWNRTY